MKLSKLPEIVRAVDNEIRLLSSELTERDEEIDECIRRKLALTLHNKSVGLNLPTNIESFLYHSRSTYELVKRFLISFCRRILEKKAFGEAQIRDVLTSAGLMTDWIDLLRDDRDLTAHETAFWCDLERVSDCPPKYEVLIGEIHDIRHERYKPLSRYRDTYLKFSESLPKLSDWLHEQVADVDKPASND